MATPSRRSRRAVFVAPLALAAIAGLAFSCSSPSTRRVDPDVDDEIGGTGIESGDVRAISDWMARSLLERLPMTGPSKPVVVLKEVANETRFIFDKDLFLSQMRTELIRNAGNRIDFLAREDMDAILAERAAKREGRVGSSGEKIILGAEYFLTGTLKGLSKSSGGDRSDYIYAEFRLVDAESTRIVWADSKDFKKVGRSGVLYR